MNRLLALALWLCLGASPAFAAITQITGTGTGGGITNVSFIGSTSGSVTPTATVNAGSLYVAIVQADNTGTNTFSNCHDNTANTWQAAAGGAAQTGSATEIWYSYTANQVTTGGSVSCTNSQAGFTIQLLAFSGTATSPFDSASPAGITNSGTSATVGPSSTLACPGGGAGCEVCITGLIFHSSGTLTSDAAWTAINGSSGEWDNGFKITSASTALSYTGTTTSSSNYAGAMACFQGPAGGASVYGGLTTTGVGP